MSTTETAPLDQSKLDAFVGRFLGDLGTALHVPTVLVGDRLGLLPRWRTASRPARPTSPSGPAPRALRQGDGWRPRRPLGTWSTTQPTAPSASPEHAVLLIDQGAPVFIPGGFQLAASTVKDEPLITEAFRTGEGVAWHDHHPDLFGGCERFFGPATPPT